jgi:hypothetical protein
MARHQERERELVCKLFSHLYQKALTTDEVGKGFERLFEVGDPVQHSRAAPHAH